MFITTSIQVLNGPGGNLVGHTDQVISSIEAQRQGTQQLINLILLQLGQPDLKPNRKPALLWLKGHFEAEAIRLDALLASKVQPVTSAAEDHTRVPAKCLPGEGRRGAGLRPRPRVSQSTPTTWTAGS